MKYDLQMYQTPNGVTPYREWFLSLDGVTSRRIDANVFRMSLGNFGNCKPIESDSVKGVFERTLDFGPGYRIYYALDCGAIILLLIGGSKRTQRQDIAKALSYWQEYKKRKESKQ